MSPASTNLKPEFAETDKKSFFPIPILRSGQAGGVQNADELTPQLSEISARFGKIGVSISSCMAALPDLLFRHSFAFERIVDSSPRKEALLMLSEEFRDRATGRAVLNNSFRADTSGYRNSLLDHFHSIHEQLTCEHSPAEAWIVADTILREEQPGPVIECGVYKGGMTAKLSRVCRDAGRELFVCDSFAGIPATATTGEDYPYHAERQDVIDKFGPADRFDAGDYCGSIDEVVQNINRFGELSVCRFVAGLFSDTLPLLGVSPALVMIDVDLVESGRDCLKALWPRLRGTSFFTHEAFNRRYMEGILDPAWWQQELAEPVPLVEGNIYGLHKHASCLARLVKNSQHD